jgi:hypothetical protein
MTVLEMHIALKQQVDRVNSLRADNLRPEETDLELNRAQMRFINQHYGINNIYRKGFEGSQKRIDELRVLLTEYSAPVTFKEELIPNKIWVDEFIFPSDYMYLVNQASRIYHNNCLPVAFTTVQAQVFFSQFNFAQTMVNGNQFVEGIRLQNTSFGTIPTIQATIWEPSASLVDSGYTISQYPQLTQEVITDMLDNPGPGFTITYNAGLFRVVVDTAMHPWFVPGTSTIVTYDNNQQQINYLLVRSRPLRPERRPVLQNLPKTTVLNRFSQQDDIYRLLDDPFNVTYKDEPLTTIRDRSIDVYSSALFIIESIKITYLRKPLNISLSLGSDCELPTHTHNEIVAMAASAILEQIGDPRYKTQMGEMAARE